MRDFDGTIRRANEALAAADFALAERLAREAGEMAPSSPKVWPILTQALRGRGALKEAVEAGRRSLALSPDSPTAALELAQTLCDAGGVEEALSLLESASARWSDGESLSRAGLR